MERIAKDLGVFTEDAEIFARNLHPRAGGATLVTLSGDLGAGKTAFVKVVAKTLGISHMVNSPTFVLEKIYPLPEHAEFHSLIHIDAYRLEKAEDLLPLKLADSMQDPGNLIMLEWPERVEGALPQPAHAITIEALPDSSRKITYA